MSSKQALDDTLRAFIAWRDRGKIRAARLKELQKKKEADRVEEEKRTATRQS